MKIVAVTDMPGRRTAAASWPVEHDLTGTRWTTFTKLPLALSGGNRLNVAPVAGEAVDVRSNCGRRTRRSKISTRLAGRDVPQLRFLELAVNQTSPSEVIAMIG